MNTSTPWEKRPIELANLFNPAFLAVLIAKVSEGYKTKSLDDLPYSVAFLAIPLIIYPSLNQQLPTSAQSKLHLWLSENQDVLFEFPDLARSLSPYVREAISFGVSHQVLELSKQAYLAPTKVKLKEWEKHPKNSEFSKKALLVGKLLGQTKQTSSLFSFFGVCP